MRRHSRSIRTRVLAAIAGASRVAGRQRFGVSASSATAGAPWSAYRATPAEGSGRRPALGTMRRGPA